MHKSVIAERNETEMLNAVGRTCTITFYNNLTVSRIHTAMLPSAMKKERDGINYSANESFIPRRNSFAELFFDLKNPKMMPITDDKSKSITRIT